ncbi:hypothetical protein EJ07DRAFT_150546 [Lizonia empirigonia]|nr:hypothetical protein EJ07DRAFT_150546 [Lizonia empirigonia]
MAWLIGWYSAAHAQDVTFPRSHGPAENSYVIRVAPILVSAVDVPYIAATPRLWLVGKGRIIFFACKDTDVCFSGWPRRSVNVQCNFVNIHKAVFAKLIERNGVFAGAGGSGNDGKCRKRRMLADAGGGTRVSSSCRPCNVMLEVLLTQVHKHRGEDFCSVMLLHAGSAVNTLLLSDHGERRTKGSQTCTVRADKNVTHE